MGNRYVSVLFAVPRKYIYSQKSRTRLVELNNAGRHRTNAHSFCGVSVFLCPGNREDFRQIMYPDKNFKSK